MGQCKEKGCDNPARTKGLCNTHYSRMRREIIAASKGEVVTTRGSEEWKRKVGEGVRGKPRTQWLDDYWRFMKAKDRRQAYRRMGKLPRTIHEKVCEWCDEPYVTTQPTISRFCSSVCRAQSYWNSFVLVGICVVCGDEFTSYGNKNPGRTCSHSCAGRLGAREAWSRHGTGKRLGSG